VVIVVLPRDEVEGNTGVGEAMPNAALCGLAFLAASSERRSFGQMSLKHLPSPLL